MRCLIQYLPKNGKTFAVTQIVRWLNYENIDSPLESIDEFHRVAQTRKKMMMLSLELCSNVSAFETWWSDFTDTGEQNADH